MSDLVSVADQKTFMGVSSSTDDTLFGTLLTMVEDAFERACNRSERPFTTADAARTEVHDGTGHAALYLDYPIDEVTAILLGYDASSPDEELDPDDLTVVTWPSGGRCISRVDGGKFGTIDQPRYVTVVYDTQDDLPEVAKLAVMRATAMLYRQRGSEDARAETSGDFSHTLGSIEEDGFWKMAVQTCREPVIV